MDAQSLQGLIDSSPFLTFLRLSVLEASAAPPKVRVRMPLHGALVRFDGADQAHGGALSALIDTAGDLAVAASLGGAAPTIDMRVDFLRPAAGAWLDAHAQARRIGRTVAVADIEIFDPDQRLCVLGRAVYAARIG